MVILGAVLEHIRDLAGMLRNVSNLLVAGGLLYAEVPDAAGFSCSGRTPPFQEFSIEHINYFSTASLANLMSVNGFREVFSRRYALEESPGLILPAIQGGFRKTEKPGGIPGRDSVTEDSLRSYISASTEADRRIFRIIDRLVKPRRPLIVWGTGTLTQRLLATGRLPKADIRAFVDSNPHYQGKSLAGVPIIPPEALRGRRETILISTIVYQDEIERTIRGELGLDNEVVTFPDH